MNNHFLLFLCWVAYFAVHSLLAAETVKVQAAQWFGGLRYYRLIYNVLSVVLLVVLLADLAGRPADFLFHAGLLSLVCGVLLALFGAAVLVAAFRNYDLSEFIGLQQVRARNDARDHSVLNTRGLNAKVRHPVYAGVLLLLAGGWLVFPTGYFGSAVASVFIYVPFGIYFEEQKLLRQFGAAYSDYQKRVKRLIPGLW